ncbi:glutamate synthase small chain [Nitrospirillum viridazoti Y2]|uniref:Glutamate synthase (NADPH/NADH) small chain n=1 Tax=Nitrospirillum amazonense TaxID=28077 RepID=A0A560HWC5_9PROT|nr:NAD(P)-dependent oxidoreductase [Nitrospirillum amazonense]EGX99684.1 glutamate synthase small chain [Nitrospirillum amazonense Y2]TWB50952.1 glutamate synthase (NADPH/NADH) small chain [Nitrospirillum amazonense]
MAQKQQMLQFVHTDQQMPDKREPALRRRDFDEIYARFADDQAATQASRCSQCGVPFCQVHCPVSNNIPDWLKLTAEGRLEEAYEVSQATNNFPEICGRICPQDRLCEGNCTIEQSTHGTVTIGAVEKYITDTAWERGWVKPAAPVRERSQSVGIIGAGPAGLAAADQLRRKGYQVHVYDRYDRVGGLLIYGIPGFKLEKEVVERRAKLLADAGVVFHLGFEVGRHATLGQLRVQHDAILIATGVYKARELEGPGSGVDGIVPALDYLTASNRTGLGDTVVDFENGRLNAKGKNVVVIGGGDTAMDCVRTAIRQGAKSVKCLYRRNRANMPGSQREVAHAEEEGVEFVWQAAPDAFLGDRQVTGVRAHRMHMGVADASGRQTPQPIEGSAFTLEADLVIKALGFDPEPLPTLFGEPGLKVSRWGTVMADPRTLMTNLEGVFAAGDIVRGASLVVWGIRDGRDAAAGIHNYIAARAATAPLAAE